jgi:hypothetical protein
MQDIDKAFPTLKNVFDREQRKKQLNKVKEYLRERYRRKWFKK